MGMEVNHTGQRRKFHMFEPLIITVSYRLLDSSQAFCVNNNRHTVISSEEAADEVWVNNIHTIVQPFGLCKMNCFNILSSSCNVKVS